MINVHVHVTLRHTFKVLGKMLILKYFWSVPKCSSEELPDPNGSLSTKIPSSAIVKANALVSSTIDKQFSQQRGTYLILTPAQKFQIEKRASEHGVTSALRYFLKHVQIYY